MAGAFTHIIICDVAKRRRSALGIELWRILNKYSEFLFLGAVSPDLPYLSFRTGHVNWADVFHYEQTNSLVRNGYELLRTNWAARTAADEVQFVWLLGYVSHLVADATIHPIVQAIVGRYDARPENRINHRICEMTQDALIFSDYKKNDIYYAEFSSILKFCRESDSFGQLMSFWKNQTVRSYTDKNEEPTPDLWFLTYTEAIDTAEGGSEAAAFFRHAGFAASYFYKTKDEILSGYPELYQNYYSGVALPGGNIGTFKKDGFERAVSNVLDIWNSLYSGLSAPAMLVSLPRNWNLDTGIDQDTANEEVTYWV